MMYIYICIYIMDHGATWKYLMNLNKIVLGILDVTIW